MYPLPLDTCQAVDVHVPTQHTHLSAVLQYCTKKESQASCCCQPASQPEPASQASSRPGFHPIARQYQLPVAPPVTLCEIQPLLRTSSHTQPKFLFARFLLAKSWTDLI